MQICHALEQLQHVAFDLRLGKVNSRVVQQARKIMIHVRCDHIHDCFFSSLPLWAFNGHLFQL